MPHTHREEQAATVVGMLFRIPGTPIENLRYVDFHTVNAGGQRMASEWLQAFTDSIGNEWEEEAVNAE